MPIVVDLARPATRPTQGQYVSILQSQTEPHVEAFTTDGTVTAPVGMPSADDRKHLTGDDAIAFGSNLVNPLFAGWTVVGDISDASPGLSFDGTTGGEASAKQNLSAQITEGEECRITFNMVYTSGSGLTVGMYDPDGIRFLEGVLGSNESQGGSNTAASYTLSFRSRQTTTAVNLSIIDPAGDVVAVITDIVVAKRAQSL